MEKEGIKLVLALVATAAILITLVFAGRVISAWQYNSQYQSQLTGSIVDNGDQPSQTSNIKRAEQTPTSCTPTQNCGRPSCAASRGGSCGCGG